MAGSHFNDFWIVRELTCANIYRDRRGQYWFETMAGDESPATYSTEKEAIEEYYISEALAQVGEVIKSNSRKKQIEIGKRCDEGTYDAA